MADVFHAKLRDSGNDKTFEITVPIEIIRGNNWKPGIVLKVLIKKVEKKKEWEE